MAKIGYARVSTREQNPDHQEDALREAGCEKIFIDRASGKLARRPKLDQLWEYIRPGDTLVITKLSRLSRSLKDLIAMSEKMTEHGVDLLVLHQGIDTTTPSGRLLFHMLGAVAEFERDLIVEGTLDGLAAARARGKVGGRRPKLTGHQLTIAREMYDTLGEDGLRKYTVQEIADTFGVNRTTIYRHLEEKATA